MDKSLWTGDCCQPGDLAATPPMGRAAGARLWRCLTYIPNIPEKKFLSVLEMWRSPEKIFELIPKNHLHPFINLT